MIGYCQRARCIKRWKICHTGMISAAQHQYPSQLTAGAFTIAAGRQRLLSSVHSMAAKVRCSGCRLRRIGKQKRAGSVCLRAIPMLMSKTLVMAHHRLRLQTTLTLRHSIVRVLEKASPISKLSICSKYALTVAKSSSRAMKRGCRYSRRVAVVNPTAIHSKKIITACET